MKIAVTGASGFVGSQLARHIEQSGHEPVPIPRGSLARPDFRGATSLIHCAGLAHGRFSRAEHQEVNNRLAVSLAAAAATAGIRRFVFVSSISVVAGNPGKLRPSMRHAPVDALGAAKADAERALLDRPPGMEIVIARPTLVYGPDVRGNLHTMMRLLDTPFPTPLGENQRSMVSVANLASALLYLGTTAQHVDRRIYHVTDGPVATASIAYWARIGMGRPPRPASFLAPLAWTALQLLGRGKIAEQLYGDLLVDGSDLLNLGWIPNSGTAADLVAMGASWRQEKA